jgi:hypothetical protein
MVEIEAPRCNGEGLFYAVGKRQQAKGKREWWLREAEAVLE